MKFLTVVVAVVLASHPALANSRSSDADIVSVLLLHPMFRFELAEREVVQALETIQKATRANSGIFTTTGTIKETAGGRLSYSAEPSDQLVAHLNDDTMNYTINLFKGDLAAPGEKFLATAHDVSFHVYYHRSLARISVSNSLKPDGHLQGGIRNSWEFDRGEFTYSGRKTFTRIRSGNQARTAITISGDVHGLGWIGQATGSLNRLVVTAPNGSRYEHVENQANGNAIDRSDASEHPFDKLEVKDMFLVGHFKNKAATSVDKWKFTGAAKIDGRDLGAPTIIRSGGRLELRLAAPLIEQLALRAWNISATP